MLGTALGWSDGELLALTRGEPDGGTSMIGAVEGAIDIDIGDDDGCSDTMFGEADGSSDAIIGDDEGSSDSSFTVGIENGGDGDLIGRLGLGSLVVSIFGLSLTSRSSLGDSVGATLIGIGRLTVGVLSGINGDG